MAELVKIPEGFILEETSPQTVPEGFVLESQQELRQEEQQSSSLEDFHRQFFGIGQTSQENDIAPSDILKGVKQVGTTIATAGASEILAGFGALRAALHGQEEKAPALVEQIREKATLQPTTEVGKEMLQATAKVVEPIGNFLKKSEKKLGDTAFKATESPALAAAASSIPTALLELTGIKGLRSAERVTKGIKKIRKKGDIVSEVQNAVPTIEQLKDTSSQIFKEIDELGATVKPAQYSQLVKKVKSDLVQGGLDPQITKKASALLKRFEDNLGKVVPATELEKLRTIASNVAKSNNRAEAALGSRAIDSLDNFLNKTDVDIFEGTAKAKIGKRYKAARELWGRARRSELIEEAFEKARNASAGFSKGIENQFRSILNSRAKIRYFNPDEIKQMQRAVRGSKGVNFAKLLGNFDVVGKTPGFLGIVGLGSAIATAGAGGLALPFVGYVSRRLADKLIKKQALLANDVIKAGKNANKIAEAYISAVPKAERSASELAELLMRNDVDLSTLKKTTFNDEVIRQVQQGRLSVNFEDIGRR